MSTPEPPVFAMPLQEILFHVWFDGFTSGLTGGCGQFLPRTEAEAKADELATSAMQSKELCAQVHASNQERMQELMQHIMATSKPVAGLKPSHLQQQPERPPKSL